MNIQQVTEVLRALSALDVTENRNITSTTLQVGKCYLIRTVTMMYTGRLVQITETDFLLEDAAWIADSGRYANALETGELSEVEPYPDKVSISRVAYVDAALWHHPLPRETK